MKFVIIFLLAFSACGEIVDKIIVEDWSGGQWSEVDGKIVLRPTLVYVTIDGDGKRVVVSEEEWTKIVLK